jgi:methylglutaconyl-CoA hydratase
MSEDLVILDRQPDGVATCTLNRPDKRNALSIELMRQLCALLEAVEGDKRIRALILRGNGPVFSAGLDLGEVMSPGRAAESARMMQRTLLGVYGASAVTIAMVHGLAVGGGAGIVAACDFALADERTRIGFPEARRGLIAAQVMSLLVRKLKGADVLGLLLSGELVDATPARQMGLFYRAGNMEREVQGILSRVLRSGPRALTLTKRLIDQLQPRSFEEDIEICLSQYLRAREGEEAEEGIRAFLEKRKAAWDKS